MEPVRRGPFNSFESAVSAEYVTVSNSGAYSSSTVSGANTRRYHALLAAPLMNPRGTFVILSALEEVLDVAGGRHYLSTHEYPGAVFPEGYRHIKTFEMEPLPTFVYEVNGVVLTKTVAMGPDEATVVVAYELDTKRDDVTLEVRPLCAFRERHVLTEANQAADTSAGKRGDWVHFMPYKGLPVLKMSFGGEFGAAADWYRRMQYRRDRERGYSGQEDLVSPGAFRAPLEAGKPVYLVATLEENAPGGAAILKAAEAFALEWTKPARRFPALAAGLAAGMRDFLVQKGSEVGILRGLPWHAEWARHAMMALPGFLALGRFIEAQSVLATWAKRGRGGLLPRFVDDHGQKGEEDVEGTLWFFEAVEEFIEYTKNYEWVRANVLAFMTSAIEAIAAGKSHATVGAEGLVYSSGHARALAAREDVTALVEIQALYFNALKVMEEIAAHFRDDASAKRFQAEAKGVHRAYNKLMWDAYNHVPVDSYSEKGIDRTPRPMALLTVSLSHPILVRRRWELLVDQLESALMTPLGLLAMPQDAPGSRQYFDGDTAEHAPKSGGIWPQFLGAFLAAHAKTFGTESSTHNERFFEYLKPLADQLRQGMLNHVPEFFDSGEPYRERGAPADAAASGQLIWALTAKVVPRYYEPDAQ